MPEDETAPNDRPAADSPERTPKARASRKRRVGISLGTLVALVSLATGILTLRDQLFPRDERIRGT